MPDTSIRYDEALDEALCYDWIDDQIEEMLKEGKKFH
jgi:hypothetical protein